MHLERKIWEKRQFTG